MKALLKRRGERLRANVLNHLPVGRKMLVLHDAERSRHLNRQLAGSLAFVAGALNAGGFLVVGVYTSHVTGNLSRAVDNLALGAGGAVLAALALVGSFFLGAFCSGLLVSLGQRRRFKGRYAFSLLIQALLLAAFAVLGSRYDLGATDLLPWVAAMLSFLMGMHNSVVTSISNAEVRTTHMTGVVTDLGIELSRLLYMNRSARRRSAPILANRNKLKLHASILVAFVVGGLLGAWGFKTYGFAFAGLFAALLLLLAVRPVLSDVESRIRLSRLRRAA